MDITERIVRTNFRFTGAIVAKSRKSLNGEIVDIPVYSNGGFVILYDNLLNKIRTKRIKLNSTDLIILVYIASELDYNTNIIRINQTKIANDCDLTQAQVSKSLKVLEDARLIQTKLRSGIVVNQNYIFKGDILKFYTEYRNLYPDEIGEIC